MNIFLFTDVDNLSRDIKDTTVYKDIVYTINPLLYIVVYKV